MSKLRKVRTQKLLILKAKARAQGSRNPNRQKSLKATWTPNTSAPQSSLSQVNTIGCADEGLWIFSLEDSKKRQHTVNWENQSDCKTDEHELMIDSGSFGHACPPWFAPQFPMVSSSNVEAVAANNVAAATLQSKSDLRTCDDEKR